MFRLRLTREAHPRVKNGQPPQSTTGVAKSNCTQVRRRAEKACCTGWPGSISDIASSKSGTVRSRLSQNRRRHVDQFGIRFLLHTHGPWFEGHTTDGAAARFGAHNLGVHGTGVHRPRHRRTPVAIGGWRHILRRVSAKFLQAVGAAEDVRYCHCRLLFPPPCAALQSFRRLGPA